MASSIQTRLKALEAQRKGVDTDEQDKLSNEIAKYERQACCLIAHMLHHGGEPVDSVLPAMLRHFDEREARSLLAMDYDSMYRAIGAPVSTASKTVPQAKNEEREKPQIRIPGEWGRGR